MYIRAYIQSQKDHQRGERTEYLDIGHRRRQMELTKSNSSKAKVKPTVLNEDTGKDDK